MGIYSDAFSKLEHLAPEVLSRTIFAQVHYNVSKTSSLSIQKIEEFLKANGVPLVIDIRKRVIEQHTRFFNMLLSSNVHYRKAEKRGIMLSQRQIDHHFTRERMEKHRLRHSAKSKMHCWFIELPTVQAVDKIMMAVEDKANYFGDRYLNIARAGTGSYFETDQTMRLKNYRAVKDSEKSRDEHSITFYQDHR